MVVRGGMPRVADGVSKNTTPVRAWYFMTIPTKFTLLRIVLTFVVVALLFLPGWVAKTAAFIGFLIASFTDWIDGYLARRWQQTSPLGALLDPIADKILTLGLLLTFVQLRLVPAWMVCLIALRECLITGVRLFMANRHLVLPAAKEGKHKTVAQLLAILTMFAVLLAQEGVRYGLVSAQTLVSLQQAMLACLWMAVALTIVSGAGFFWRHRAVLREVMVRG